MIGAGLLVYGLFVTLERRERRAILRSEWQKALGGTATRKEDVRNSLGVSERKFWFESEGNSPGVGESEGSKGVNS